MKGLLYCPQDPKLSKSNMFIKVEQRTDLHVFFDGNR